jgi:hypothetical protein
MPRATKTEPDPAAIYVAWQSFAAEGLAGVIEEGTRLRGDDPAVKAYFAFFVEDGLPKHEWPSARQQVNDLLEEQDPPPDVDLWLRSEPVAVKDSDIATLRRPLRVAVGHDGKGRPKGTVSFVPGTRFPRDSEIVRAAAEAFE